MVTARFKDEADFNTFRAEWDALRVEKRQLMAGIQVRIDQIERELNSRLARINEAISESLWGSHPRCDMEGVYWNDDAFYIEYRDSHDYQCDMDVRFDVLWGESAVEREARVRKETAEKAEAAKAARKKAREALEIQALAHFTEEELKLLKGH
jgi:hypothetical protein